MSASAAPRRAGLDAATGIGCLLLFVLLALLVPRTPLAVERDWAGWMRDLRSSGLTHVALVFNTLGRGVARGVVVAVPAVFLLVVRRFTALAAFAAAEAATPLLSSLTKALVDRPRPPGELVHPGGASFPSGHAAFAAVTAIALVLLFTPPGPGRRGWWTLAALAVAAMAWSRTYLQVHWLLDVAGGSLLGAGVALVACAAARPRRG